MENNASEEIMDKLTKTCICKSIPRAVIKGVIKNGAETVEEVQKLTGAGSGGCKGRRCTPRIQMLLDNK